LMQSSKDIWKLIVNSLRKKMEDPDIFNALMIKTREISVKDNVLNIEVESDFVRDKITENYMNDMRKELAVILKAESVKIRLLTAEKGTFENNNELIDHTAQKPSRTAEKQAEPKPVQMALISEPAPVKVEDDLEKLQREHEMHEAKVSASGLHPRYTFETFLVGKSNQLAHSVSVNVAKYPGKQYNPLFIYGGSGLGKTHLMQAIAHHILKANKRAGTIYVTCETFLNEMVNAIQNNKLQKFREKYRSTDLLLIDDIQFISGKEGTQEEFFHTFNHLYQSGKQIVLTSDKQPNEIPRLEERLVSRFQSGMVSDIQAPDLELRMAILQNQRDMSGKPISNEIIAYIAQKIEGNIRRLEGALIKVIAIADVTRREINENLIDEALFDMSQAGTRKVTIDVVLKTVAEYYKISVQDLKSKNRSAKIAGPRHVAMYICKYIVDDASSPMIGRELGGRDHSTVLHGIKEVENKMMGDVSISNEIEGLMQKIRKK